MDSLADKWSKAVERSKELRSARLMVVKQRSQRKGAPELSGDISKEHRAESMEVTRGQRMGSRLG